MEKAASDVLIKSVVYLHLSAPLRVEVEGWRPRGKQVKTNLIKSATHPALKPQPPTDLAPGDLSVSGLRERSREKPSSLPTFSP